MPANLGIADSSTSSPFSPSYPLDVCLGPSAELDNELLFTGEAACRKIPRGGNNARGARKASAVGPSVGDPGRGTRPAVAGLARSRLLWAAEVSLTRPAGAPRHLKGRALPRTQTQKRSFFSSEL